MSIVNMQGSLSIGFNPNYLMDPLKNINEQEIALEVCRPGQERASSGGRAGITYI
jgi:DNA polymerase III sliding clamp (beta) subunit (PCNA family)